MFLGDIEPRVTSRQWMTGGAWWALGLELQRKAASEWLWLVPPLGMTPAAISQTDWPVGWQNLQTHPSYLVALPTANPHSLPEKLPFPKYSYLPLTLLDTEGVEWNLKYSRESQNVRQPSCDSEIKSPPGLQHPLHILASPLPKIFYDLPCSEHRTVFSEGH